MTASVNNYTIGKGIVSFSDDGSTWVDAGNCPSFEFTPSVTKLDHYSSRTGTKTKDLSVVTEKQGKLKIKLDEITLDNLHLALLTGTSSTSSGEILASTAVTKHVKLEMANDVGNKFDIIFPNVSFIPSAAVQFINDGFMELDIEGDVLADNTGSFGTISAAV